MGKARICSEQDGRGWRIIQTTNTGMWSFIIGLFGLSYGAQVRSKASLGKIDMIELRLPLAEKVSTNESRLRLY